MTPEELESLVKQADAGALADAMAPLTEPERQKLSKTAATLLREIERYERQQRTEQIDSHVSDVMQRLLHGALPGPSLHDKRTAAQLAVFGLCPLTGARKASVHARSGEAGGDALVRILSCRRPEWINQWLADELKKDWPTIEWHEFWTLYKAGVCEKPAAEDYYRYMASHLTGWRNYGDGASRRLSDLLAAEPELLEDVWKLFEVDTIAFAFDWQYKDETIESWPSALCRMADLGTIDRQRLLDATLKALTAGFRQVLLTNFVRLHDRLSPTTEEITNRKATYADLLSVGAAPVVAFAMKMLNGVDRAGRLDDEAFVAAAAAVFDTPTKAPAKTALTLLAKIAKRSPQLRPKIADVLVTSALAHRADDVVVAAAEQLVRSRDDLTAETLEKLAAIVGDLPATAQPALDEILRAAGESARRPTPAAEPSSALGELRAQIETLDARWRLLAGVDEARAAIDERRWPGPLEFTMLEVPVLSGVEPVRPVETVDELRELVAHSVEGVDEALDFERILDGISRLPRERTPEFQRLAAPLIKRAHERPHDFSGRSLMIPALTPVGFARLLQWWFGDCSESEGSDPAWFDQPWDEHLIVPALHRFFDRRSKELWQRLIRGQCGPLLSMPTHQAGWIDPLVLVDRLRGSLEQGRTLLQTDLALALLRLAPDRRTEALDAAGEIDHPWAAVVRWALGDSSAPPRIDKAEFTLWVAAANTRGDAQAFATVARTGFCGDAPDATMPARYTWKAEVRQWQEPHDKWRPEAHIAFTVTPDVPPLDDFLDLPTVLLHSLDKSSYWHESVWMIGLLATIQPGNVSGQLASGVQTMLERIDAHGSAYEPNHPYLSPLFDVDRPMDELACLLLAVGLLGRDQDVRGLAIDAAVESIQDGRLHPRIFGATLATLSVPGWLKLNRLCGNLEEIARLGPLHAWVVCDSLQLLLAAYDELPRDAHHLLALVEKLLTELGGELQVPAKQRLSAFTGGGKTGKLARSLEKLTAQGGAAADQARGQLLESRLDRAQRWQRAASGVSPQGVGS